MNDWHFSKHFAPIVMVNSANLLKLFFAYENPYALKYNAQSCQVCDILSKAYESDVSLGKEKAYSYFITKCTKETQYSTTQGSEY